MVRNRCGLLNGIDVATDGFRGGLSLAWTVDSMVNLRSFFEKS